MIPIRACALAAAIFVGLLAPGAASAGTLSEARGQLLSQQLQPPPLFPTSLPPTFRGADVAVVQNPAADYSVEFSKNNCGGVSFCVSLQRFGPGTLDSIIHDPQNLSLTQMRIGQRTVYAANTGHSGAPALLAWAEQGRTYMVSEKYEYLDTALPNLVALVESLSVLSAPVCRPLTLVSVRGSGETSTGTGDTNASPVTLRIYQAMTGVLAKGAPAPGFYQVPYAALSTNALVAGTGSGSLRARVDRFFQNLATYISGEKQGVANLASYISGTIAACPGARFVLAGYSQGAMVVHDYLTLLAQRPPSPERSALSGEVLVADPERTPSSRVQNFGTARATDYGVCRTSEGVVHVAVCVAGSRTEDIPSVFQNVWQVCDEGDIVCDTSVLRHRNTLSGWKAQLKGGTLIHTGYCAAGQRGVRCETSVTTAAQAVGRHLPRGQ